MDINKDAIGSAALSLAKVLAAELLRKGILDYQEFVAAVSSEIDRQRGLAAPANADTAVLLSVYLDEIDPKATGS